MISKVTWDYIYEQIQKLNIKELHYDDVGVGERIMITYNNDNEDIMIFDYDGEVTYYVRDGEASEALRW